MAAKGKKNAKKDRDGDADKLICRNRKALHNYEISEKEEAGIVLTGTEVKSLRNGLASLEDAYARVENRELWLIGMDIPEYAMGNLMNHTRKRKRKLLLHRREIEKFTQASSEKGYSILPLRLYFKNGKVKVQIAIGRGKKVHDKRETLKEKDAKLEMQRAMRSRQGR